MVNKSLENKIKQIRNYYLLNYCIKSNNAFLEKASIYIQIIESSYSHLSKLDQMIINNEFFYGDYPDWWRPYFTSPLFSKLKMEAMKKFVEGIRYECC